MIRNFPNVLIIALLTIFQWVTQHSHGSQMLRKCVLGDSLLNSLVGSGVQQKDDFTAEETVLGWSSGSLDGIASNLTEAELKDCLQEYDKVSNVIDRKPLPPGVTPEKDPSQQLYLPPAAGKDVLISENGYGHGEYYTTYDGSKYKFKEKGYVIDPPAIDSTNGTTVPPPPQKPSQPQKPSTVGTTTTTSRPGKGSSKKNQDELQKWYKAFVSVVSKYM